MENIALYLSVIFALICVGIFVCAILSSYFDAMKDLEDSEQEENQSRKRYIDSMVRAHQEGILEEMVMIRELELNTFMEVTKLENEEFQKWFDNLFTLKKIENYENLQK